MAAILVDDIFKCIFVNENGRILIKISLKYPINNKPALVYWSPVRHQAITWAEPMMIQFVDAYMRHQGDEWNVLVI